MRLAVMPGNGLRLPAPACEIPPGNRKPSVLYRDDPTNEGICAGGAGDATGDWNRPFRLPDLALCATCSGAVDGRESALAGRSPWIFPLAACKCQIRESDSCRSLAAPRWCPLPCALSAADRLCAALSQWTLRRRHTSKSQQLQLPKSALPL